MLTSSSLASEKADNESTAKYQHMQRHKVSQRLANVGVVLVWELIIVTSRKTIFVILRCFSYRWLLIYENNLKERLSVRLKDR